MILGAGFTGLAAGIKTGLPVFEATDQAGGICRSYQEDGFTFSRGGPHWIFGKGKGLEFIKSLVPLNEYKRKASVYYNHHFPYPIQTYFEKAHKDYTNPMSFAGSLFSKFGLPQCNMFFYPFNESYTAGLMGDIILEDDYKTPKAGNNGHVPTFGDPVNGLNDLIDQMSSKCDIRFKKRVFRIVPETKQVFFTDGTVETYNKLISTIPMDKLMKFCGRETYDLPYTSVLVVNIGAERGKHTPDEHWVYTPFQRFYRLGFSTNADPKKAPKGKVNLSVEMAFHGLSLAEIDIEGITKETVETLQDWGFIGETLVVDPTWVSTAYTWLKADNKRQEYLDWLKSCDIISTGRYGSWKFQGMTQSIEDGFNVEV